MPNYRIFPSIGIARVGGDDDYYLGPEIPGQGPIELADGKPVRRFKSSDQKLVRKQGSRFRLYQSDDGDSWQPAELPDGASVEWEVTLQNKKSAVERPFSPSTGPIRPVIDATLMDMSIAPPTSAIRGASQVGEKIQDSFSTHGDDGTTFNATVTLGRLETDPDGNLIVIGGDGEAGSPPGTPVGGSYYRNPNWYDDVSDGPIGAKIVFDDGTDPVAVDGAWVIVGPPDFAPNIGGVVTLYDMLQNIGFEMGDLPPAPTTPSFDLDILPIIERARGHRFVHESGNWGNSAFDSPKLRSKDPGDKPLRKAVKEKIENVENILDGHVDPAGPAYKLPKHQVDILQAWVDGNFDGTGATFGNAPTAAGLTKSALEGAVGPGFCPGIEAGILMLDPTIYQRPFDFKIDQTVLNPGDLTALMAQPWQADFLKCHTEWWPSVRPDITPQTEDFTDNLPWNRGVTSHQDLIDDYQRLGFVVDLNSDGIFVENERDPDLAV